jgi:hypothetical protein
MHPGQIHGVIAAQAGTQQAGIQFVTNAVLAAWHRIPAFARMTSCLGTLVKASRPLWGVKRPRSLLSR